MKALVVEDDFTSRKVLQKLLIENFETDIAVDGEEAWIAFKQAFTNNEKYDVIFLDIMMPKKDGLQLLIEIRQFEEENGVLGLDGVKVIMTTALDDSKNVLNAFKAGCEGYVVKPYNRQKIYDKLEELGLMNGE
ncbi:MAG: response regulator [Calditrichaeota bacterium]|nr:MAG: response regulator [Calditrichota bacterium]MBL1203994.1 response regulator [Calditrichota bacterium]NOG43825.1 response regulator [Calditrichota bacterium]